MVSTTTMSAKPATRSTAGMSAKPATKPSAGMAAKAAPTIDECSVLRESTAPGGKPTICKSASYIPASAGSIAASCMGPAADNPAAGIAATKTGAQEAGAVKPAADKEIGISAFKEGTIVGIIVIIPVMAVPGRKVVIQIPGELVFIDNPIAAGIAVRVRIHILIGIRVLVGVGILVSIRILVHWGRRSVDRSRSAIDNRRGRYINAGAPKTQMSIYIYLRITFAGDQQTGGSQRGQC